MIPLNLKSLEKFISTSIDNYLFINHQDEKIQFFYLYLIKHYCQRAGYDVKLINTIDALKSETDLFAKPKIFVLLRSSESGIKQIISRSQKIIIFTEYKIYKKYQKDYLSLNSYDFKQDLHYLVCHDYKISNNNLINFLKQNPEYTYSEISKSLINIDGFLQLLQENSDDKIAKLRKEIYKTKAEPKTDIKKLDALVKQEVGLKKFNFLTY